MANILHLDFETYSELDIKRVGTHKYAKHPSTEVMLAAFAVGNGKVHLWDATTGKPIPALLRQHLNHPNTRIHAFNAPFERLILHYVLGFKLPLERFRCEMVHAYNFAFSGGLADVAKQIGLPSDKQKDARGKQLLNKFCSPAPKNHKLDRYTPETSPEEWEEFCEYCVQDVVAERAVKHFLDQYPMRDTEWEHWLLDQKINDRGMPVDMELVEKALALADKSRIRALKRMAKITSLDNPNSPAQLKTWLHEQGYPIPNLQAATIEEWLESAPPGPVRQALRIRQQISKASVSKYEALRESVEEDGRMRGTLQFLGASRTGRFAGRRFQPQNLMRPPKGFDVDEAIEKILSGAKNIRTPFIALASSVRGCIAAEEGKIITVSDLSGIEGRVLPWECYFKEKLAKIEGGLDTYVVAATGIFNKNYDRVTDWERFVGKVAELSLGYQGGWRALNKMAKAYGLPQWTEEAGSTIVYAWRGANEPIVDHWARMEDAAIMAVDNPGEIWDAGRISFQRDRDFLFMLLPSGRRLSYFKPLIVEGKLTYMGLDTFTRQWQRTKSYGGKLTENATQAISYDIMMGNAPKAERKGFLLIGSVHDELLSEHRVKKTLTPEALSRCLTSPFDWAKGVPLNAAGYSAKRYRKD